MNAKVRKPPIWLVAIAILMPTSFSALATTATNVAIPHISGYFAATADEAKWIVTSYMVAQSALMAYVDAFAIVALLAFILIPVSLFMSNDIKK